MRVPECKMGLLAFTVYLQSIPKPSTLFLTANCRKRLEEIISVLLVENSFVTEICVCKCCPG